jgi:integral membrane protein (TIGR01906 family)
MNRQLWHRLLHGLIVLALPMALLVADIRIATGHWFVRWEYSKADFPPDPYGLTPAERTHLAEVCVDYLATGADIALLADLRLPDGAPAFNARELRHMADVQVVYRQLMIAGLAAALIVVAGSVALGVCGASQRIPAALFGGSLLTLALLGLVGATMLLTWDQFFTTFHRIFFEGETWLFPISDTLIRLFPIRFWMDVALVIVTPLAAEALLIGAASWAWMRSNQSPRISSSD